MTTLIMFICNGGLLCLYAQLFYMNNFIILYMIAGWLLFRALLSFVHAFRAWKYGLRGAQLVLLVLIGILNLFHCKIIDFATR